MGWNFKKHSFHIWNQHPRIYHKWIFKQCSKFLGMARFLQRSREWECPGWKNFENLISGGTSVRHKRVYREVTFLILLSLMRPFNIETSGQEINCALKNQFSFFSTSYMLLYQLSAFKWLQWSSSFLLNGSIFLSPFSFTANLRTFHNLYYISHENVSLLPS